MIISISELNNYSWLKNSLLYEELSEFEDSDDKIDVPICLEKENDIELLVKVLNFWGVRFYPYEVCSSLHDKKQKLNDVLKDYYEIKEIEPFVRKISIFAKVADNFLCENSAREGYLDILMYAKEKGYNWNVFTTSDAALNGHLDCLKYAHENGCPWNVMTCALASSNGHLDCLKYAHENGCPWNSDTCLLAIENGHPDCLKYANEHGCPLTGYMIELAIDKGYYNYLNL